jgi:hypothetical protein
MHERERARTVRGAGAPAALHLGLAGIGLAGVLAGHALTYALVTRGSPARLLAASGHGYLDAAVRFGLAGAVVGILALFADRLRRTLGGGRARPLHGRELVPRLVAIQATAFLLQELVERRVAGAPVAGVLEHGLLGIGLAWQLVLAALGARFLAWLLRTADRIGEGLRAPRRRARTAAARWPRRAERSAGPSPRALTARSLRGPPHLLTARTSAR